MIPEELLALIRRFEGLRLKPYLCPAGVPTVGYGHTQGVRIGMPAITKDMAELFLREDALEACLLVLRASPVAWKSDRVLAVLADFVFNLGISRYLASTLKRRVDREDWEGAAQELGKWVWGGGRKLPGLIQRRAAEAALLRGVVVS